MSKLLLPATINPPRIRKDGSCSISFDTRELTAEEILIILSHRNTEGWVCWAPNENEIAVPEEDAQVEGKTHSERLRGVLFVWWKQETEAKRFVGPFETFKAERMERIIQSIKDKLA